jgi:hypothetical protein
VDAIVESPNAEYATETREELLYNKGTSQSSVLFAGISLLVLDTDLAQRNCWPTETSGSLSWRRPSGRMLPTDKGQACVWDRECYWGHICRQICT